MPRRGQRIQPRATPWEKAAIQCIRDIIEKEKLARERRRKATESAGVRLGLEPLGERIVPARHAPAIEPPGELLVSSAFDNPLSVSVQAPEFSNFADEFAKRGARGLDVSNAAPSGNGGGQEHGGGSAPAPSGGADQGPIPAPGIGGAAGTGSVGTAAAPDLSTLQTLAIWSGAGAQGWTQSTTARSSSHPERVATTITLSEAPEFPVAGQPITFTAVISSVDPGVRHITGQVSFSSDGVFLGTSPVEKVNGVFQARKNKGDRHVY